VITKNHSEYRHRTYNTSSAEEISDGSPEEHEETKNLVNLKM
jgi:hypothetical protein